MSSTPVLIPVEEYLSTMYRPDCDYIDGEVQERNMGEMPHARLQNFFIGFFARYADELNIEVLPEQRLQTGERRYRIPDIMLLPLPNPEPRIVRTPPALCVEILSSEDRMSRIQERIDDYAQMGVPASWVIDPWKREAFSAGPDGVLQPVAGALTVPNTPISIAVAAIFAELDRLEKRAAAVRP